MIRILRTEGIRRMELPGMVMHTVPADVIRTPALQFVPLKGTRAAELAVSRRVRGRDGLTGPWSGKAA